MTCWAIAPIKAPEHCKTRLRAPLADKARLALVDAMLRHVAETAGSASGIDQVFVLGPSAHGLPNSTPLLPAPGVDLNAELAEARRAAMEHGVDRLIVIAADLPRLTREDMEALAMSGTSRCAIAADRAGHGTNAVSLPLPAAARFAFQFGENSFTRHRAEAARLGLHVDIVRSETLALDIDEAEDLRALPARFRSLL